MVRYVQFSVIQNMLLIGITKWINDWKKNYWRTSSKKRVQNKDLWEILDNLVKSNNIKFQWIPGNSMDEIYKIDQIAKQQTKI